MAPGPRVEPLQQAPERTAVDLFATLGPDGLARSLVRLGAAHGDAITAASLVHAAAPRLAPGTSIAIRLGQRDGAGRRPVERVALRASMDLKLLVERGADGLALTRIPIPVTTTPLRVRGRAGDGLYWALRTAGASSATAASYLEGAGAGDRRRRNRRPTTASTWSLSSRRSADGQASEGALLYAGLDRMMDSDLQLVKWSAGGKPVWVNAATIGQAPRQSEGLAWPVAARITSGFGYRIHPILRFARMHRGIDFGAGWGTPIRAAADGQVVRAGWAGGYGRQVRLAHGGGIATSYSHMSRMTVAPGTLVHQGQLIGYVGSSGLSTGPHLHYEVHRHGVAVNPMGVRFTRPRAAPTPAPIAAIKARLKELLSVGAKRG